MTCKALSLLRLEKDRGSVAEKFLKAVADVISLGLARWWGHWDIRGKTVSLNINGTLHPAKPSGHAPSCSL